MDFGPHWFVAGWISLHVTALAWAGVTRVAAGSRLETLAELGFYVALAAIGLATWLGPRVEAGWTWSAMTFMAMVITAVVDFRRTAEPAHIGVHF
jgi:hypothetical protein